MADPKSRFLASLFLLLLLLSSSIGLADVEEPEQSTIEQPEPTAPVPRTPYDLSRMEVFSWVILQIKQDYVDPFRVRPDAMLRRALQFIERRIAEVQINLKDDVAEVQVGGEKESFRVGKPGTIWEMNYSLQPIVKFIAGHLESTSDPKDVEFAAINGLLSTIDPHSNLLPPELFREMQLKTTGEFGGLGIRITIRKEALTIISPLPDTPAARLGLKAMDQIVRIGDQSTVNMPLDEAVNMLRGKPGSKVTIWVMRPGWSEPHKYVIARETIQVRSIESKLLEHQIGYIQIVDFAKNTAGDLLRHLTDLKREAKGLKGLILDLRNNAGGLMKAAVQVADQFLDSGIIVATVSYSEDSTPEKPQQKSREEQRASGDGIERNLPIVVLVNSGSASASEILAGALKNLDRALVIGEQTFGKGTVQILNDRVPDSVAGACLKLTVAEYLIPGDVSIQEVGVTPDVQLVPLVLDKDNVQAFAQPDRFREQDIPAHLKMHNANVLKPAEVLSFVVETPKKKVTGEEEEPPLDEPGFKEDFETRLARDFLLRVKTPKGSAMLDEGAAFLREAQAQEQKKMEEQMAKLNIDWTKGSGVGAKGVVEFKLLGEAVDAEGRARADQNARMTLTVRNTGSTPFFRLRAESACKHELFARREFLFGRVAPGQSKTWELPIKMPRGVTSRTDDLRFSFFCEDGEPPAPLVTTVTTVGLPQPSFGFSVRILDPEGNGDGLIEPGERVGLELTVYNQGAGTAFDAKALLKNNAGKDLFLEAGKGRIALKEIPPGQARSEMFSFRVREDCKQDELRIELTIWDSALGSTQVADLRLPVFRSNILKVEKIKEGLEVRKTRAEVRGGADLRAPVIALAKKGALLLSDRRLGPWYRIAGKTPVGWIHKEAVALGKAAPTRPVASGAVQPLCQATPPKLEVDPLPAYLKEGTTILLKGRVVDEDSDVRDVSVWVGNEKVFLESGSRSHNPRAMTFELPISLDPGPNFVTIVAREGSKFSSQRTTVITRPGGLDWKKKEEFPGELEDQSLFME